MNWSETEDRAYKVAKYTDPTITRGQVRLTLRAMRAIFFQAVEDHEDIFWPGMFRITYKDVPERMAWNPRKRERYLHPAHTKLSHRFGENLKVAAGQKETTQHYKRPEGFWKELPEDGEASDEVS